MYSPTDLMGDFCRYCGAGIPPIFGEGTCEKCAVECDCTTECKEHMSSWLCQKWPKNNKKNEKISSVRLEPGGLPK